MFDTVLVADRGVAARRVVRTCQRLGLRAVTVHSTADAGAAHVRDADESLLLGGHDLTGSYLDGTKLLEAAGQAAAQAVHPGGGPLAGSAGFARAVVDAGLVWLGAPPDALLATSRPASTGGRRICVHLLAGPGGARVLTDSTDHDGLAVCAVPHLGEEQRRAAHDAALAAVTAAGLTGLVTVTVALEPGTAVVGVLPALGLEHPAVELVTGLDLVEHQLRLAQGEPLPDVTVTGAAALTVLRAAGPGTLTGWEPPTGDGVRVESAVEPGDPTPPYDDLLATLAVHGADVGAAVARLHAARAQWVIAGVEVRSGA